MTSAKCSMKYDFQTMSQVLYHPKNYWRLGTQRLQCPSQEISRNILFQVPSSSFMWYFPMRSTFPKPWHRGVGCRSWAPWVQEIITQRSRWRWRGWGWVDHQPMDGWVKLFSMIYNMVFIYCVKNMNFTYWGFDPEVAFLECPTNESTELLGMGWWISGG